MCPLSEWLYVGSSHALAVRDKLDPTMGEVVRIAPDGSWEVVTGEARDTPHGSKASVSGIMEKAVKEVGGFDLLSLSNLSRHGKYRSF